MHPAISHYFYEQADPRKTRDYHKIAGSYFVRAFRKSVPKNVTLLIEAIHHIAASGDITQARALGAHKEQLRALGKVAYGRRDWEESIRYYEAITRVDATDYDALGHMALALGHLARWVEADAYLQKAKAVKESVWLYQSYGAIKIQMGLSFEGEGLLNRALGLNNHDSATLASLGVLRWQQNRDYEAEKLLEEALSFYPENTFALANLTKFLVAHGRKSEARAYAELWVELEPRNPQARQLLRQCSEPAAARAADPAR